MRVVDGFQGRYYFPSEYYDEARNKALNLNNINERELKWHTNPKYYRGKKKNIEYNTIGFLAEKVVKEYYRKENVKVKNLAEVNITGLNYQDRPDSEKRKADIELTDSFGSFKTEVKGRSRKRSIGLQEVIINKERHKKRINEIDKYCFAILFPERPSSEETFTDIYVYDYNDIVNWNKYKTKNVVYRNVKPCYESKKY